MILLTIIRRISHSDTRWDPYAEFKTAIYIYTDRTSLTISNLQGNIFL